MFQYGLPEGVVSAADGDEDGDQVYRLRVFKQPGTRPELLRVTVGLRDDTNLESTGIPHSGDLVVHERVWLADKNTLKDEITLVDAKAYTKPWTVTKTYHRAEAGFSLLPYVCLENNRNPINENGEIGVILEDGGR